MHLHHISYLIFIQANGLDERFNQTLQGMLVKVTQDRKEHWDKYLDSCVYAYNTSRHESTKFTPFELMFGRKAVLPIEIDIEKKDVDQQTEPFSTELSSSALEAIINRRQKLLGEAKENILKAQQRQKEDYDKRKANPSAYKVGSTASTKERLAGGKMDDKYLGPFTITKRLGKALQLVDNPTIKVERVNGAHLKPYLTHNPPTSPSQSSSPPHNAPTSQLQKSALSHSPQSKPPTELSFISPTIANTEIVPEPSLSFLDENIFILPAPAPALKLLSSSSGPYPFPMLLSSPKNSTPPLKRRHSQCEELTKETPPTPSTVDPPCKKYRNEQAFARDSKRQLQEYALKRSRSKTV